MPWHLSRSDPRKVYDERHETVCVTQAAEQAMYIVDAVNFARERGLAPRGNAIKLREPGSRGEQETSADIVRGATGDSSESLVHTSLAEGCCAKHIAKASLSGTLNNLQPWECPKCGTTYWPRREGPVVNWEARAAAMVFKL